MTSAPFPAWIISFPLIMQWILTCTDRSTLRVQEPNRSAVPGGQLDFVLGAYLSNGGKSFICMSSTFTAKDGTVNSRIRPTLANGSIVTDTRANVHYFVTEYGIVNLKGLSSWQKAEAIISVAHPDFRDQLIAEAEQMKIWKQSNKR